MSLEITITTRQKVLARMRPTTMAGKPAPIEGIPEWYIVSGDGTVEAADNGLSAELVSPDLPGLTIYMVTIDADLGNGVEEVSDLIHLTAVDPNAPTLTAGTPEPKT